MLTKPIPEFSQTQQAAFWAKVDRLSHPDCWLWTAATLAEGYGVFNGFKAHRVAYSLTWADIPPGHTIDHLCRNRACVNPEHLECVTAAENMRRGRINKSKARYPSRKRDPERFGRRRERGLCVQCNTPSEKYRCDRCRAIHNERNRGRTR